MQGHLQHLKDSDLGDRVNESDLYQQMRYPYSANHTRDQGSSQHALTGRSDDGGPLEAVTNQLAQHMTVLAADVQALKTRHTAKVQALKTQLTADVQALKTQLTADVQALTASDAQQHRAIQAARGSTFVQWGSSTCAWTSELVYSGVVGGSWYDHSGAAANALCLSLSPKFLYKNPDSYARLYGGEYKTDDSHQNRGPAYAVCRSPKPTTIMVPGTNDQLTVSRGTVQQVSRGTVQQVSRGTVQQVSRGTVQQVSRGTVQQVSRGTVQQVSRGTVQQVSRGTVQQVSRGTVQQVSRGTVQQVSRGTVQQVSRGTVQQVSRGTVQQVSRGTVQQVSRGTVQQVSMSLRALLAPSSFTTPPY
ncbi:hypothetical protein ACOMHN_027582 [Nucella lapillus]